MKEVLGSVKEIIQNIDALSALIFLFCILLFFVFLALGFYFLRKKIIAALFFLISFFCLVATPSIIALSEKLFFYKIEILRNDSKPLVYSDSFLIDLEFKNQGKREFDKCLVVIIPERKNQNWENKILDFIKPLASYKYKVKERIHINQVFYIQKILPYKHRDYSFKMTLDCR
ncbi:MULTISPECIES: DUF2393 family protein [unclassified Helicobacter]|uniref:DUF2393 family protein n=1 Tax=unclassified Helicobacter TaxID=2593540 RepID=UPI0013150DAB|nr:MULTISPECIES: DUF2393 family protein [unclassified Helicobacter]